MTSPERHILFVAYCWGGAGSTWLAWALNSHKDIMCMHAPSFPRFDRHDRRDVLAIVDAFRSLAALGGSYACVGFTHGVRREWHGDLVGRYGGALRAFVLTRHPIKRIASLTALKLTARPRRASSPREWLAQWRSRARLSAALRRTGLPRDAGSMAFYHACRAANRIVSEVETGLPIRRFEDLVGSAEGFRELLRYVSDGRLTMSSEQIRDLQGTVKGKHAPRRRSVEETFAEWSESQKEGFRQLMSPQALAAYEQLGYEFPEAARRAPQPE